MPTAGEYTEIFARLNELEQRIIKLEQQKSTSSGKKRKASPYNLYMGECIKELKGTKPIQQLFKECARRYKEQKSE